MANDETDLARLVQAQLAPITEQPNLPVLLQSQLNQYPENRRRPVNKTVFKAGDFQLTLNVRTRELSVTAPDLIYSAIPYDTGRNYLQRAAVQYLLHPSAVTSYLALHRVNVLQYLKLSLFQTTHQRFEDDSPEVLRAYQAIETDPLLKIQVVGRMLQHDETGPLSANLAGKFLKSTNDHTGITAYLSAYLAFVIELAHALPISTDGRTVKLQSATAPTAFLTRATDVQPALTTLPLTLQAQVSTALSPRTQPLRRSEVGAQLAQNRKNYVAHSVQPAKLEPYFTNVLPTTNDHQINVVADIHATGAHLPFSNPNFNIIAGDASDAHLGDAAIHGIYVIGNHDLADVLPTTDDQANAAWEPWRPYLDRPWFQQLVRDPDDAWFKLPIGDDPFYDVVATQLRARFPQMQILNNASVIHKGVRYVGLTVPIALAKRRRQLQTFIRQTLTRLLTGNPALPTVIVSHAPLFNELSLLSANSRAYKKTYGCQDPALEQLFATHNVVGVIHGHHHMPASAGRVKWVTFAGKRRFVVCSIYSKMNTGLDLSTVLNQVEK